MTERVICIDGSLPRRGHWLGDPVIKGRIYTVIELRPNPYHPDQIGYILEEVSAPSLSDGSPRGYGARRFVPISDESKDIELFREMDRKIFKRKKIDA